jgi:hypothetical protein
MTLSPCLATVAAVGSSSTPMVSFVISRGRARRVWRVFLDRGRAVCARRTISPASDPRPDPCRRWELRPDRLRG